MHLYTAKAAQEASSAANPQFPAKLLASVIAPTANTTPPLVNGVRVAAAGQVTPQLFAALDAADQSLLVTVSVPAPVTPGCWLAHIESLAVSLCNILHASLPVCSIWNGKFPTGLQHLHDSSQPRTCTICCSVGEELALYSSLYAVYSKQLPILLLPWLLLYAAANLGCFFCP